MKHIKSFNEGWKENIASSIVLSLSTLFGTAQTTNTYKSTFKTHNKELAESLLKKGWKLNKTEVDTIWNKLKENSPNSEVQVTEMKLDKNQFFESGKFETTDEMMNGIDSIFNSILDKNAILIKINIESSTDKQGLAIPLQNQLKNLGFTPDNKGLSNARINSIKKLLVDGDRISTDIINTNILSEQGEKEIEQSARYVFIQFYYVLRPSTPPEDPTYKIKTQYNLEKGMTSTNRKLKADHKSIKIKKLDKLKNLPHKVKDLKCQVWNN
jgi:hypothetical protein